MLLDMHVVSAHTRTRSDGSEVFVGNTCGGTGEDGATRAAGVAGRAAEGAQVSLFD
ncbi:MAG: hypothetical protein R3F59_19060 [Myxococcota bacterium]